MNERIVIKIGSNVLTKPDGQPDTAMLAGLVTQLSDLWRKGHEVILVTSGAVAFGRSVIRLEDSRNSVETRQLLAAVGQIRLINTYRLLFEAQGIQCAQLLVTKEDFRDRQHYLHMRACIEGLLKQRVIPVINENDVIAVSELMFTDNDELGGLLTTMTNAARLVILSNVDGILEDGQVIEKIELNRSMAGIITASRSSFGRGGMLTKANLAHKLAKLGIPVHIANGKKPGIITGVLNGEVVHTQFVSAARKTGKKRWVAWAQDTSGSVTINEGAYAALNGDTATSLLMVGVTAVIGDFQRGDIIHILNADQKEIGLGIARYSAEMATASIGKKGLRPMIHYDHLCLFN